MFFANALVNSNNFQDAEFNWSNGEFSDNELGDAYRSYLQYELPRSIDRQFRTIKRAEARYLGGAVAALEANNLVLTHFTHHLPRG